MASIDPRGGTLVVMLAGSTQYYYQRSDGTYDTTNVTLPRTYEGQVPAALIDVIDRR